MANSVISRMITTVTTSVTTVKTTTKDTESRHVFFNSENPDRLDTTTQTAECKRQRAIWADEDVVAVDESDTK